MAFLLVEEALVLIAEAATVVEGWAAVVDEAVVPLISGSVEMADYGAMAGELAGTANAVAETAENANTLWRAVGAAAAVGELTYKAIEDSARVIGRKFKKHPTSDGPGPKRPKPTAARQLFKDHNSNRGHHLFPAKAHCYPGYPNLMTRQYFSPLLII